MSHGESDDDSSLPEGFLVNNVRNRGPGSLFDVDTCPEREVLFRRFPNNLGQDIETFEMTPEAALDLADKLISVARHVIVRQVLRC